jgi:hypothetical protein
VLRPVTEADEDQQARFREPPELEIGIRHRSFSPR